MMSSFQKYYELLVCDQPDFIKHFLIRNHLNKISIAAEWLTDAEYNFFVNGFRKKIILRPDFIFKKLKERYKESQNVGKAKASIKSKNRKGKVLEQVAVSEGKDDEDTIRKPLDIRLPISCQKLLVEHFLSAFEKLSTDAQCILNKNKIRGYDQIIPYIKREKDVDNNLFKYNRQRTAEVEIIHLFESLREYAIFLQSGINQSRNGMADNCNHTTIPNDEKEQQLILTHQKKEQKTLLNSTIREHTETSTIQSLYIRLWQNLSVRAQNVLALNNLTSVEDLEPWVSGTITSFGHLRNCGRKTEDELKQMVSNLFTERQKEAYANVNTNDKIIVKVQSLIDDFLATASTRTVNLMKYYKLCTTEQLLPYILNVKLIAPIQNYHSKTTKIYKEYTDFINFARVEIASMKRTSDETVITVPLSTYVPLKNTDCDFAIKFKEKNGYWPMFSLLHKYYQLTENIQEQIFSEYAGFYTNVLRYDEISRKYGLTQERVRQIIHSTKDAPNPIVRAFLSLEDWDKYPIHNISYIGRENIDIVTSIEQMEGVGECTHRIENGIYDSSTTCISIHDICLLLQFFGYECYWLDRKNCIISSYYTRDISEADLILISNKYRDFRFKKALREAKRLCRLRTEGEVSISIKNYFVLNDDYWAKNTILDEEQSNTLALILEELFDSMMDVRIEQHQIIVKPNFNYSDAIYQILRLSGKRLQIDDIYTRLVSYCNEYGIKCKYSNPSKIRSIMYSDDRITSIGKSTFWGLVEWGETIGSIRKIAIKKTKNSRNPIKINDLSKLVMKERPDSNKGSVEAIIRQATNDKELLLFYGDYVGLPNREYSEDYILMPQTFDEWLQAFRAFVEKNKRFPYSSQDGYEGYLYRWHYRSKQLTDLTSNEIVKIDALEKELSHYPHNATENKFLQNCNLYKRFVEGNNRMLKESDDKNLFKWFYSASRDYSSYNDNRTKYFSQLLQYLSSKLY